MPLLTVSVVLAGVLALIGHPVAMEGSQEEPPDKPRGSKRTRRRDKLVDLLGVGLLAAGDKLVSLDPRWPGEGVVTAEGWIDVAGGSYWPPSGAAKVLSGRKAEAGWDFWAVGSADGPTLNEPRGNLTLSAANSPTQATVPGHLSTQPADGH